MVLNKLHIMLTKITIVDIFKIVIKHALTTQQLNLNYKYPKQRISMKQ